ncbi:MAG TPA: GGDEF domain-containing protein [Steroidobacteraceae bacterium]|nr:GGDEF domain-containing protein [Steroidobacteraceae bacterium]
MNPEIEAHLRSLVNFPSPPGVATHIIELAQDPDIEMSKVAKALSMDSALATKILRIANSPLYAQRRKSENLRQALVVLGLNATLTLALSFSLVKSLRSGKANGLDHPLYWRRALLAATCARALADAMHHPLAEDIFLAALLQDVGMLALDQVMPDLYRGVTSQRDHAALADIESKRLQTDHASIGGWLMRTWNLPERLHLAISHSHHLELAFTAEPNQIFERCVALSGPVADLFILDAQQRCFAETAQSAERSLGLDKMAFGQVLGTIGAMIPETEAIFDCEALAKQHPELILEQAREVLMLRSLHALREINTLRAAAETGGSRTLELEEETRRDPLTGLYNRAHLDEMLAREFENASRHNWPLSIAFADLDSFKTINDRFGHQAGDRILQATARILRGNTRETDLLARYGGAEFVVVLPATDAVTAQGVCERIVAAFRSTWHMVGSDQATVTVSIGCATHGEHTAFANIADFINAADQALYTAKLRGRNRTVPYDRQIPGVLAARQR